MGPAEPVPSVYSALRGTALGRRQNSHAGRKSRAGDPMLCLVFMGVLSGMPGHLSRDLASPQKASETLSPPDLPPGEASSRCCRLCCRPALLLCLSPHLFRRAVLRSRGPWAWRPRQGPLGGSELMEPGTVLLTPSRRVSASFYDRPTPAHLSRLNLQPRGTRSLLTPSDPESPGDSSPDALPIQPTQTGKPAQGATEDRTVRLLRSLWHAASFPGAVWDTVAGIFPWRCRRPASRLRRCCWPAGHANAHAQAARHKRERPPGARVTVTAPRGLGNHRLSDLAKQGPSVAMPQLWATPPRSPGSLPPRSRDFESGRVEPG
ncbi:hypothetical protein AAY473_040294 [Plecturocebus cupreus]